MAEIPPTQFAAYPRGNSVSNSGTVEQLEALRFEAVNPTFLLKVVKK